MKTGTTAATLAVLAVAAMVPAMAAGSASVGVTGEGIQVVGDEAQNSIAVADREDPECPGGSPCYEVSTRWDPVAASGPCVATGSPPEGTARALCPIAGIAGIAVFGREGDDNLIVSEFAYSPGLGVDLLGGTGHDYLQGAGQADTISGSEGYDEIHARGGNDVVKGQAGGDKVYGGKGDDRILGGPGFDNLIGGLGTDRLFGGAGNDGMDGAAGRDLCNGAEGRDTPRNCEKRVAIP